MYTEMYENPKAWFREKLKNAVIDEDQFFPVKICTRIYSNEFKSINNEFLSFLFIYYDRFRSNTELTWIRQISNEASVTRRNLYKRLSRFFLTETRTFRDWLSS